MHLAIQPEEVLVALDAMLASSHALLPSRPRLSVTLTEGERFVIDPTGSRRVHTDWEDDNVQVRIVTNRQTLEDLVLGRLDPSALGKGQLLLWSGDPAVLQEIKNALGSSGSLLNFRATMGKGD